MLFRWSRIWGSSPLARGLRAHIRIGLIPDRIIPARAGFTGSAGREVCATWDHPRSRGVYSDSGSSRGGSSGSSPLARGLPPPPAWPRRGRRIIPARAGFTRRPGAGAPARRDHPRSRGVYCSGRGRSPRRRGSSPLARGLHVGAVEVGGVVGIIPARAGFTPAPAGGAATDRDHPRSRGVYPRYALRISSSRGSSPLARGLLGGRRLPESTLRIIPARAGFTRMTSTLIWCEPDHPRSRGVYRESHPAVGSLEGSSPLARGLRSHSLYSDQALWIIPARAGFTRTPAPAPPTARDHPRSRGVYPDPFARRLTPCGSSPLARGLHRSRPPRGVPAADHPRSRGVYSGSMPISHAANGSSPLARGLLELGSARPHGAGIIPARAGFTSRRSTRSSTGWDHPRSRGVYGDEAGPDSRGLGSSPLARGLRSDGARGHALLGIIPARAGFTAERAGAGGSEGDHPRSRGVYTALAWRAIWFRGSSPLARGLQAVHDHGGGSGRIIPARAGFTLADPWNPNEPVLYQTPAAFTADPGPAPPSCGSAVVVPRWTTTPSGA